MALKFEISSPAQMEMLQEAIKDKVDKITKEEIEKAKVKIEKRLEQAIAALSINLFSQINISEMTNELVIKIRKD